MHLFNSNPAFAANLTSAVFQSLSLVFFFLASYQIFKFFPASLIGTFILGYSAFFWDQATFAEVFGLNNVFVSLLLLLIFKTASTKPPLIIWAIFGLAVSHHQTSLFLLPGYLGLLLTRRPKFSWIKAIFVFSLSFSIPYLWIYFGLNPNAPLSWYFDHSFGGIVQLLSRNVYASTGSAIEIYANNFDLAHSLISLGSLISHLISHFSLIGFGLGLVGLTLLPKLPCHIRRFLIITLIISGPLLAIYLKFPLASQTNAHQFYTGTYLRLRMFLLFELIFSLFIPFGIYRLAKTKLLLTAVFALVPIYLFFHHYPVVNKHSANFYQVFSAQILTNLPENSLLMVDSDLVFSLLYQQSLHQLRPDILILPTAMHMRWGYLHSYLPQDIFNITGYYRLLTSLSQWGITTKRPLFVLDPGTNFLKFASQSGYYLTPFGYTLQLSTTPLIIQDYNYGLTFQLANFTPNPQDYWTKGSLGALSTLHTNLAHYYRLAQAESELTFT